MAQEPSPYKKNINDFFEAIGNVIIFLPYYFSIKTLVKTMFAPWKNLTTTKTKRGFSFADWSNSVSFNLISRLMGFVMRSSILLFYMLLQVSFIVIIPLLILGFFITLPLRMLFITSQDTESEKKAKYKQSFITAHLSNVDNYQKVEEWFEYIYPTIYTRNPWWKLQSLFANPPLARDWAVGYTPTLDEYVEDLTKASFQVSIRGQIIGREKESQLIERILSESDEANAIIVGEEGVGKHTILQAFARRLYEGKTNSLLAYKRLLLLNMEKILAEHEDPKERENFLEQLFKEASTSKSVILVIENFDRYVSSGSGRIDLSASIEKHAGTPHLQILGITTPFLYETYIYSNEKIRNITTKIDVEEIDQQTAMKILMLETFTYENRYKVTIPYETLTAVIDKSNYYITTIPYPEKALQLLDKACVYAVQTLKTNVIQPEIIDAVLTAETHTPTTLNETLKKQLLSLESQLNARILGQEAAMQIVSSTLRRSFILLGKRKKPLASFLFLGPTGVGKTETAKAISEIFFGSDKELIRFDMSLYQTKEDIQKLIGSVEKLNPGLLTNEIRENPYAVLLIDEMEKANKDLLNIFLTLLDEGYFTDGYGQRVDCKNLVIVATSNAGADHVHQLLIKQSLSNQQEQGLSSNAMIDYLIEQNIFNPEFLNRFDGVIAFNAIENDSAQVIARRMMDTVTEQIYEVYKVKVEISDETLAKLTNDGYSSQHGARNLQRILRQSIEDTIATKILSNQVKAGDTITI
ncbi:MAG: AAA family ATPase [Weeksellaceae bacterium]